MTSFGDVLFARTGGLDHLIVRSVPFGEKAIAETSCCIMDDFKKAPGALPASAGSARRFSPVAAGDLHTRVLRTCLRQTSMQR